MIDIFLQSINVFNIYSPVSCNCDIYELKKKKKKKEKKKYTLIRNVLSFFYRDLIKFQTLIRFSDVDFFVLIHHLFFVEST